MGLLKRLARFGLGRKLSFELARFRSRAALLAAERDAYLRQRDEAIGERDAYLRQRDEALGERDEILRQRDGARAERDAYLRQRDEALGERNEFQRQRDVAIGERNELQRQRDAALAGGDKLYLDPERLRADRAASHHPRFFIVTSEGRTASYWLAAALHAHPDVICGHSKQTPPIPNYSERLEVTPELLKRVYGDLSRLPRCYR